MGGWRPTKLAQCAPWSVPRLLEQLQRERDGQPLTSRRLVVFVFNGHNHYDATVPQ